MSADGRQAVMPEALAETKVLEDTPCGCSGRAYRCCPGCWTTRTCRR